MTGFFGNIKERIVKYIEVNVNLVKVGLIGRISDLLSHFMLAMVGLFVAFCFLLFFGFSLAEFLNEFGLPRSVAYLLTTVFFGLLCLIVFLMRKGIIRFFTNSFITVLTGDDELDADAGNETIE